MHRNECPPSGGAELIVEQNGYLFPQKFVRVLRSYLILQVLSNVSFRHQLHAGVGLRGASSTFPFLFQLTTFVFFVFFLLPFSVFVCYVIVQDLSSTKTQTKTMVTLIHTHANLLVFNNRKPHANRKN